MFDGRAFGRSRRDMTSSSCPVRTRPWAIFRTRSVRTPGCCVTAPNSSTGPRPAVVSVSVAMMSAGRSWSRAADGRDEIEAARLLAVRHARACEGSCAGAIRFGEGARPPPGGMPAPFIWPLLEVMAGIDVLVGSGGYNTVHEARATATPLVALARRGNTTAKHVACRPRERAADEADVIRRVEHTSFRDR